MLSPIKTLSSSPCTTTTTHSPPRPSKLLLFVRHRRPSLVRPPSLSSHRRRAPLHGPTTSLCNAKFDSSGAGEREQDEDGEVLYGDKYDATEDVAMEDEEDEDEDDEMESSVDLFLRFLQSMAKKLSRRAKRVSRAVLPSVISPQLVSFAVDGVLLLAALSLVKALLEVACTLGTTVFAVILLLRVIRAAMSYFQSSGNTSNRSDGSSFAL